MAESDRESFADPGEIRRTRPDRVLYDPTGGKQRRWDDAEFCWRNEHILVQETADGNLLAMWTAGRPGILRIAYSRSQDAGKNWTKAAYLDGSGVDGGYKAAWQVPVIAPSGRVYVFYTYDYGNTGSNFFGGLRCRYSDDHGRTWSAPVDLDFPPTSIDSPAGQYPPIWISCGMHKDSQGRALIPYTHWARNRQLPAGDAPIKERYCHIELMRIENLAEDPAPTDLQIRWLSQDNPVTVPHAHSPGASFAQEPYLVTLPNERLFMVIRTNLGEVWYTVSGDGGESWRAAEPMRTRDGGDILPQPSAPCPVFALDGGDYLFLYNDNDGFVFGADHVWDIRNRRPAYLARGEFRPGAYQPIWWSAPKLFVDNNAVPWGPGSGRLEAAAYCSFTAHRGERILWYPDRKGFLVGKIITDEFLGDLAVPLAAV